MHRDNPISPILQELDELRDLLEVIRQTPAAPEVLYKLAGEKVNSLAADIQALPRETAAGTDGEETPSDTPVTPPADSALRSAPEQDADPAASEENFPMEDMLDDEEEFPFEVEYITSEAQDDNGAAPSETSDREQQNGPSVVFSPDTAESAAPAIGTEVSLEEVMQRKKARDIRKAMTLNDRFRFLRELFMNSDETMNAAIDALEKISAFDDARIYLQEQFDWDSESEAVLDFMALVEKHYL
ncbi:MAG: hypothetical protein J1E02_09060 [Coprobacter sp.]|nr:hypothetical protein [Coprobacter sp.]